MTTLVLAAIEVGQGCCIAAFQGLDIIKRSLTKEQRKQERAKRMADSVRADIESLR